MRRIKLFMWGYQPHFRATISSLTEQVLQLIGVDVKPSVLLVGVSRPGHTVNYEVCIEPEDGPWSISTFAKLPELVEQAVKVHPMQRMHYGDEATMREKPETITRLAIGEEVKRLLKQDDVSTGVQSFCTSAYPVDDYYVVCAIQIPDRLFRRFPPIVYRWDDQDVETSFLQECLDVLLAEARGALARPDPGRALWSRSMRTPPEIVEQAARRFMRVPFIGRFNTSDFFEQFNTLAQLKYEGRSGVGRILLATENDPEVEYVIRFAKPVSLRQIRWARKALQMAGDDVALIADYDSIFGLGRISGNAPPPYCIDLLDHHQWDFRCGDQVLLRIRFGEARLPQERFDDDRFVDNLRRLFVGITDDAIARFRESLDALLRFPHGSMLVIADDAAAEARRLERQGTAIEPTPLSTELLARASSIDGSILADPEGVCHAVGVILDGTANDDCTPSRGARFNSAVRYVGSGPSQRLAFVVSEDRTLDMIPLLRKRVGRKEIEQAVTAMPQATIENYHKTRTFLDSRRFYLSAEQCSIVNDALDRIESAPREVGRLLIVTERFSPDPAMNDTYFKE